MSGLLRTLVSALLPAVLTGVLLPAPLAASPLDELPLASRLATIRELLAPLPDVAGQSADRFAVDATTRRHQAFQLFRTLPPEAQAEVGDLFAPPQEGYECLISSRLPLRSCYLARRPQAIPRAEEVLALAEEAWDRQVSELGFWPPRSGTAAKPYAGMDFYVGDAYSYGASGYTSPFDVDTTTPQHDCLAYIVIEERLDSADVGHVVRHEFNHGCQMAMDCAELAASMEATAVWQEAATAEQPDGYFHWTVAYFQGFPERPIPWDGTDALYKYGSSLFLRFVHEFLGQGDPRTVVSLWEKTVQYDEVNEPDLLDAILELAGEQGYDLGELLQAFGEWRLFLGALDDGAHLRFAGALEGAEVSIGNQLYLQDPAQLPLTQRILLPQLAYYYADLQVDPAAFPLEGPGLLTIGGARDSLDRWALSLWLFRAGQPAESFTTILDWDDAEPLQVPAAKLAGIERAILILHNAQLDTDWDPPWAEDLFTLQVDWRVPPQVVAADPPALEPGARRDVVFSGSGFATGARVALSGGCELDGACRWRSSSELVCPVRVASGAAPGPCQVHVDNQPGTAGLSGDATGLLQVVAPAGPVPRSTRPSRATVGEELLLQVRGESLDGLVSCAFSCPGVTVQSLHPVDAGLLYLRVAIAAEVAPGACDLLVQDGFGQEARLDAALAVVAPVAPTPPEDPVGDDGCQVVRAGQPSGAMLLLGLVGLSLLATRRRAR